MPSVREVIRAEEEDVLVGVVMSLTGGSANPSVVRSQVQQWKRRIADEDQTVQNLDRNLGSVLPE